MILLVIAQLRVARFVDGAAPGIFAMTWIILVGA